MGLQSVLDQARLDWLETTGEPFTYRSAASGRTTATRVTVELEVEVMDNDGMMVKHTVGFLPSNAVPSVGLGDTLTDQTSGKKYTVQEKYEDNGTFQSLYLKPDA